MISRLLIIPFFLIFTTQLTIGQDSLSFLALGDSYTIGESVAEDECWPMQLKNALLANGVLVENPLIIAKTGWRTDELKAAIEEQNPHRNYDMVGLLIGVNNQYQGKSSASYRPEFEELLEIAITHAGGDKNKVFVLSIPDYGYTPFGAKNQKKISTELDAYNKINREITASKGVKYYYITDISRANDKTLVAKDSLHPSGEQYARWIKLILQDEAFTDSLR